MILRTHTSPKSIQILQETAVKCCLCEDTITDVNIVVIGTHNHRSRSRIVTSVTRHLHTIMADVVQTQTKTSNLQKKGSGTWECKSKAKRVTGRRNYLWSKRTECRDWSRRTDNAKSVYPSAHDRGGRVRTTLFDSHSVWKPVQDMCSSREEEQSAT